jgi:dihydrofolate reductase
MTATTVTVDLFVSVDGWAGSADSPGYFGYDGPDLMAWIEESSAQPHVALLGRRTYEMFASMPVEAHDGTWIQELDKIVFSRTLDSVSWPKTELCTVDAIEEVGRRKAEGGLPMRTMGSLSLARQLLAAGLVDSLRVMTFPLLVGPGGREAAFEQVATADLELVNHRVFDGRTVLLEYRPTGKDIPRA